MGENRPDNGGVIPPDEGGNAHSDGLPALPPEWGTIIIPDDASELDAEAAAVRRELRLRGTRSRSRPGEPAAELLPGREQPSFAVPVVIMVVAVLTTLVSLFVAAWGRPAQPLPGATLTTSAAQDAPAPESGAGAGRGTALGEVRLVDPAGGALRLADLLPAVILFVDDCACGQLVLDVARIVPAGVTVVALGETPPVIFGASTNVRSLAAAKDSILRTRYAAGVSPPPDAVTAVIVNGSAAVVAVIPGAETASDITPLTGL